MEPKVHHRIHMCPQSVPILSHIDPVHVLTSQFLNIYFNIILSSTPGFYKRSLPLRFPHQNPAHASQLPIRATYPAHLILLDFITRTILGEDYKSLSSTLCGFLHPLLPRPSYAQTLPSTPYPQTPSAYVPLSMPQTRFHIHTIQRAKL
jgi:hypothetical protein